MDLRDDPSTTTTTDYDSGDSEGVDYVYEKQIYTGRKTTKGRSPARRKSPKAKSRGVPRCVCGAGREEEDAEITVFEEDTDTEDERGQRRRPTKPRPCGPARFSGCDGEDHSNPDKRRPAEGKARRAQTPYIEEYPDDIPRPAILLKEHRIPRRASTSDAKRVRDLDGRSLSSGSRGRSPTGKRLPPGPPRRHSKESRKHSSHHKYRIESHGRREDKATESDALDLDSDTSERGPAARHSRHEPVPKRHSGVARSSAWNENPQSVYSSSWPLRAGSHLPHGQTERRDRDDESGDDSDEDRFDDDIANDGRHRVNHAQRLAFRERGQEHGRRAERQTVREVRQREVPPARERERARQPSPRPRPRPRTIVSRASMASMDQGYRSVATSLCEVWRGQHDDWESPYASPSEDDFDSDIDEPVRLLRMENLPSRRSSPRLLPPRGERRDFGFQATNHLPPAYPHHPFDPNEPQVAPFSDIYNNEPWPTPIQDIRFLLDGPAALTMEPDAMTDDEVPRNAQRPPSRASRWSSSMPGPTTRRAAWTQPLPPRSRAVSPVFSARRTREFLSPRPTRATRFDFGAWGCGRASRSSVRLGLL